MAVLGIDLGGTKLALALFEVSGRIITKKTLLLEDRKGAEVAELIISGIKNFTSEPGMEISAIGVAVPGIYSKNNSTVWAPNIPGWDEYPLLKELLAATSVPVTIDSDRACYISGESWQGNARGCRDAIFISVGTGIGAGIMTEGKILRGAYDIAGAIGWMALAPWQNEFESCGCFESYASGEGIAKRAKKEINSASAYNGVLKEKSVDEITAYDVFDAYNKNDQLAQQVISDCIVYWGMAVANLISIFNPEKIIFGGGIFGPAKKFIPAITEEARKWAQPISMKQVSIEASALGGDAGVYGAAHLAFQIETQNK